MPYKITRVDGKYKVTSPHGVKSKGSTEANAKKQVRLLPAIKRNPNFRPRA